MYRRKFLPSGFPAHEYSDAVRSCAVVTKFDEHACTVSIVRWSNAHVWLAAAALAVLVAVAARWILLIAVPPTPGVAASPSDRADLEATRAALAAAPPFGTPTVRQPPDALAASKLNLRLVGVYVSPAPAQSYALFALDNKPPKVVARGREIAAGVLLDEVGADHALIRRRGALERVDFPKRERVAAAAAARAPVAASEAALAPVPDDRLGDNAKLPAEGPDLRPGPR